MLADLAADLRRWAALAPMKPQPDWAPVATLIEAAEQLGRRSRVGHTN